MEKQEEAKISVPEYDGMSIAQIEIKIKELHVMSRGHQKEMYDCLEYLRTTNRYKENQRYKKSSFWQYLQDNFNILQGNYRENVRAYDKFPKYAMEYGVGIITKIDRICGGMRVEKVLSEIQQESTMRKTPFPRDRIETIIQRHRITSRKPKDKTDWKAMFEGEKLAHEKTKEALKIAVAKVKELNEQIEKLKITAGKVNRVRKIIDERPMQAAAQG